MTNANEDLNELNRLFPAVREYQTLALKHKINDIFQDNGGKYLQLQIILGLTTNGKREGNDATDCNGHEFEIKTVNLDLQKQFSTHHHLNQTIINKYRKVDWFFAVYKGIELQVIYRMKPAAMEEHYAKWETTLSEEGREHINNPKVPLLNVMKKGTVEYLPAGSPPFSLPTKASKAHAAVFDVGVDDF